jgi:hypothetical protein
MRDPGADSGEFPQPFLPDSQAGSHESGQADGELAPPFFPGAAYEPPPEVITDQVAGLTPLAVELPPITDFLYDESMTQEAAPEEVPAPAMEMQDTYADQADTGAPDVQPAYALEPEAALPEAQAAPPEEEAAPPEQGAAPQEPEPPPHPPPQPRHSPTRGFVPPLPGFGPPRTTPERLGRDAYASRQTPRTPVPPPADWGAPRQRPATPAQPVAQPADSWATGEWQRYDWRSAASLAPEERARAAQAWADLDWEGDTKNRARERNEMIASALEAIARRVRTGELLVHGHPTMTEEAAAAAALAALLARRP